MGGRQCSLYKCGDAAERFYRMSIFIRGMEERGFYIEGLEMRFPDDGKMTIPPADVLNRHIGTWYEVFGSNTKWSDVRVEIGSVMGTDVIGAPMPRARVAELAAEHMARQALMRRRPAVAFRGDSMFIVMSNRMAAEGKLAAWLGPILAAKGYKLSLTDREEPLYPECKWYRIVTVYGEPIIFALLDNDLLPLADGKGGVEMKMWRDIFDVDGIPGQQDPLQIQRELKELKDMFRDYIAAEPQRKRAPRKAANKQTA